MRPIVAAALLVLLAAPSIAAAAPCDRRGSHTLRETSEVRIYELRGIPDEERVYGCLRRTGRSTFLGADSFPRGGKPHRFRLAGRFVAYSRLWVANDGGLLHVVVKDLARRRVRHFWEFGQDYQDEELRVRGAALKRNGSFAFLAGPTDGPFQQDPPMPGGPEYSVHVAERGGRRTLDDGPDVRRWSFRATGRRIHWRRVATRRSARFR